MEAAPTKTPESPLGYREYRELWTANASSNFGSQVQVVGATWLMASLTNSPQLIAMVQTAINLPTVFFILAGGAMADNFDRRRIMLLTQSGMFAVAMLLAGLSWYQLVTPWLLLALTFMISGLSSINNPAWQSSVRDILPRDMISRAVALNSMSINLARTAGPALGGVVVTIAGAAVAFVVNALSFVAFIVALIRWKPTPKPRTTPRERILPAMAAGIRYASLAPHLRNTIVRGGLSGISASAAFALLPVVARQEMGGSALLYGILLAAFGFGAVISAYVGGKLRAKLTPDQVVRIATASLATGLATLALAPNPIVAGIGAALTGSGWVMTHTTYNTTVQLTTPQWVTGRSLALYQTATFAGMAMGSLLFGWIAEHYNVSAALLIASGGQILAGLGAFAMPLPRLDEMKVDPLDLWKPPQLEEEIGTDEGPIFVELEYAIPAENKAEFLAAIRDRERIRKRDGARDWALWQDLEYRDRWVESYHVPTWGDYLRHNSRRTMADLENTQMLRGLNINPTGPTVRRYRKNIRH